MLGKASPFFKHTYLRACAGGTIFVINSGYLSLTARSLGLPILPFLVSIFLLGLGHHALGNLVPVISQGAGPLVVSMQEDNASSWSAPNLNATDGDIADTLTWSVSSAAANGIATISGSGSAPSPFTYVPNLNFFGSDSFVAQVSDGALTDSITVKVQVIPGPSPIFAASVNGAGTVPTQTVLAAVGSMTSVTSISAPVGTTPPFQLTATRGSMTDVSIRAGPVGTSPAFQLEGIAGSMGNLSVTTSVVASTPSFQITPVGGSMSSIQVVGPWSVFSYTGKGSGFFPSKAADISLIFLPNYPAIDGLFTSQTTTASVAGDGTLSFTIPAALQSGTHFISATPQWYHIPSASNLGSGYVQGFQPWVKVKRNGTELPTTGLNAVVATGIVGADGKVDITFTGNAVDDVNVTIEVEPVYEFDTMNFSGKGSNYHVSENGSSLSKPVITISPPSGGTNQTVDSTVAANGTLSFTLPSTTTKGGVHTISAAAGKYYQLPPVNDLGSGYASGVHPATTMTRNGDVLLALSSSVTAGADGKVDLTFSGNAGAGPLLVEVAPGSPAWVEGINSINVASAGTNYAVNDLITISGGGGGTGAAAKVSSVGSGGEILSVSVVSQGTGFSSAPNATIAPPQKALHAPYLITVASVSASRGQASAGKTIDWSGMSGVQGDDAALQSNSRQHMWAPGNETSWIQWDFGSLKTVGRMLVWQFNEAGKPNRSIQKAKLEYSEDGAHWTDFSVSGNWPKSSGAIDNHTVKSIDDLNFKARYVRLTGINSYPADEPQTGVSEVLFWSPKDAYIYTSSPSSGSANAFDDNTSSVWMPLQSALPNIYLAWQFTNPVQVNEYKILVGDVLPEKRSPKSFKLQAFDIISSTWVDLASENNETGWTADELRAYSVDSPDFYINYKLLISAAEGVDTYLGLREIELWGGSGGSGAVLSASLTTVNTSPFVGQGSGYHPSENPTIRIPTPTGNDNNQTVTASVSANGKLTFTLPAPLEPEVYTISADLGTYYQLPAVFDRGSGYPSGHSPGVTFKRGDNAVAGMSGSATAAADGKVDSTFTGNAGSFTPVDVQILPGPLAFTPPSFSDQGSSKYDVSETPVVTITAPSSSTQTVNATVDANGTLDFTLPTPSETGVHDVNASFGSVVLLPSGLNGIGSGYLQSGATPSVTITDPLGASRPGTVVTVNANGTLNLDFSSVSPTIAGDYLLNAEIIAYPPTPLSNVASGFNPDGFPPIVTFSGVDKGTLSANASVNVDGTLNVTFSGAPSGYGNLSLSVTQAPGNLPKTDAEKIIATDSNTSDQFGYSVSQSSDFVAVGAPGENSNAGAVYLYIPEANGSMSFMTKLTPSDTSASDRFGISVFQSGSFLVVGASGKNNNAGAAYVYRFESNGTTNGSTPTFQLTPTIGATSPISATVLASGSTPNFQLTPTAGSTAASIVNLTTAAAVITPKVEAVQGTGSHIESVNAFAGEEISIATSVTAGGNAAEIPAWTANPVTPNGNLSQKGVTDSSGNLWFVTDDGVVQKVAAGDPAAAGTGVLTTIPGLSGADYVSKPIILSVGGQEHLFVCGQNGANDGRGHRINLATGARTEFTSASGGSETLRGLSEHNGKLYMAYSKAAGFGQKRGEIVRFNDDMSRDNTWGNGNGRVMDTGANTGWDFGNDGESRVEMAFSGGNLYVQMDNGSSSRIQSWDVASGTVSAENNFSGTGFISSGVSGGTQVHSPVIDGGNVYAAVDSTVFGGQNRILARRLNGSAIAGWSDINLPGTEQVIQNPVVNGANLYVSTDQGNVYSYSKTTGALVGNFASGSANNLTMPVFDGTDFYVGQDNGRLHKVDSATMTRDGSWPAGVAAAGGIGAPPLVVGNKVYVGSPSRVQGFEAPAGGTTLTNKTYVAGANDYLTTHSVGDTFAVTVKDTAGVLTNWTGTATVVDDGGVGKLNFTGFSGSDDLTGNANVTVVSPAVTPTLPASLKIGSDYVTGDTPKVTVNKPGPDNTPGNADDTSEDLLSTGATPKVKVITQSMITAGTLGFDGAAYVAGDLGKLNVDLSGVPPDGTGNYTLIADAGAIHLDLTHANSTLADHGAGYSAGETVAFIPGSSSGITFTGTASATVNGSGKIDVDTSSITPTSTGTLTLAFDGAILTPANLANVGSGYNIAEGAPSVSITNGTGNKGTLVATSTINGDGTLNITFAGNAGAKGTLSVQAGNGTFFQIPAANDRGTGYVPGASPVLSMTRGGVPVAGITGSTTADAGGLVDISFNGNAGSSVPVDVSVASSTLAWSVAGGVYSGIGTGYQASENPVVTITPPSGAGNASTINAVVSLGGALGFTLPTPIETGAHTITVAGGAHYNIPSVENKGSGYVNGAAPTVTITRGGVPVAGLAGIAVGGVDGKVDLTFTGDAVNSVPVDVAVASSSVSGSVTLVQKLSMPNASPSDYFGTSVSQSGNLIAIGAALADANGQTDAGAVYLYRLEANGSITYLDEVVAPEGMTGDSVGQSVSLAGNTLAVGAYKADLPGKADAGATYLYRVEANGTATYLTKLIAPDGGVGDTFGLSASQSGDILAIGACKADLPGKADAGATYLYRVEANGTATYLDKLLAPDGNAGDEFGLSVSQSGNILTVGASSVDVAATNVGAAYLFQLEANGMATFLEKLTAPDAAAGNFFGHSVSQFGARLAVGSPFSDTSGKTDSGAAYVFRNRLWGNHKPVFSNASFAQFENNATSFFANATDLDPDDITAYSKSGPDAPLFTINVATGELYFTTPPDFENPVDSDGDNRYMVEITASDGISNTMQQFVVRVHNALEGSEKPSFVSVDLSGGTGASDYPVTYLNERPDDWNSSVYKTDKILLKWIAPGTFTMGQTGIENPFQVTQGVEFYIGVYETTGSQYAKVTGSDPSGKGGGMKPVENVSWEDLRGGVWPDGGPAGTSFLGKLRSKTSGAFFDLPTEAQWEYAARAGGATTFSHGDGNATLGDYAWYLANSGNTTHEVGLKLPNPWDLYDLHGNVWEWCLDWRSAYAGGAVVDPVGSKSGTERINRGGSYNGSSDWARLSHRGDLDPITGDTTKGMRLVLNHSGRLTNRAPTDITASSTAVLELESVGTLVGDFNASDPESNATHVFSLVQGSGSDQNNLFDIDANGTLTTKVVLGHEANATLSIRVRATDDYNASFDKVFAIEVLNVNETPVITQGASVSVVMDEDGDPLGWPLAWPSEDLNGTDPEGDVITWSLQTAPVHGTASVGGSGAKPTTFTYSPNPHYNGTDSFVVKLSDGLLSDSIIINVRINPRPENGLIPLAKSLTYDLQIPDANNFLFTGGGYSEAPDPDLVLMEGVNYRFSPKIGDHPFFIGSSAGVPYAGNELTGNGAEGPDGILSFIPNEDTPRQLVYYCASDGTMRGDIKIISARQNKLVRPNPRPGDQFGISMSVLGNQVLVGSNGESRNGLSNTGSAHLFERDLNGKWLPVQAFRASSPEAGGRLGRDVSLWHNLVVAGAPGHDSVAGLKGAAYVFEKNATSWSQAAKLSPSDGAIHDYFGQSVSARTNQVLVGAHMADPGGVSAAGAAYIFEKSGSGTWLEKTKLVPGDSLANGHYGVSVSLDGDLALVGASGSNNANGVSTGAAYLIGRTESDTWVQITKLTPDDGVANDQFGQSVKLDGNFSYVGARLRGEGGVQDTGAVYVFQRLSNGQWVQQAKITPENAGAEGYFGQSLDVRDNRLLVGAPGKIGDHAKSNPGYAYLFERDGIGNWTQKAKFVGYDGLSDDEMGFDVALGVSIFAGAPFRDDRGEDSGGAYVFDNSNWNDLPPVFSSEDDLTITMDEDGQPLAWVSPNVTASDPNGDVLSWRAYYENPSESNGTVVVFGTGASPETFQYRPKNDFHGTDTFTLEVSDGLYVKKLKVVVTVNGQVDEGEPVVRMMPGFLQSSLYANAKIGVPIAIWGSVENGVPPFDYSLDFGDGQSVQGSVTDARFVGMDHQYQTSGLKTAVLTITDSIGQVVKANTQVRVFLPSRVTLNETRNMAMERGLLYLYLNAVEDVQTNGLKWLDTKQETVYTTATTGFASMAFSGFGHSALTVSAVHAYGDVVRKALRYLTENEAVGMKDIPDHSDDGLAVRQSDDPTGKVPGKGVYLVETGGHDAYSNSIALLALLNSFPEGDKASETLVAGGPFVGWTYKEVAEEAMQLLFWTQGDDDTRGGWEYRLTQDQPQYDGSVQQWPVLALKTAQEKWGLNVPTWVKDNVDHAYATITNASGAVGYRSNSHWLNVAKTGGRLVSDAWMGRPSADPLAVPSITFISDRWMTSDGWTRGLYAAYGVKKGLSATGLKMIQSLEGPRDWDVDMASWLLGIETNLAPSMNPQEREKEKGFGQYEDGHWQGYRSSTFSTALALGILSRGSTDFPPMPEASFPQAVSAHKPFFIDGAKSYHSDPLRSIADWKWKWNWSGSASSIDWNTPDAVGLRPMHPGFTSTGQREFAMRVTDDGDPAKSSVKVFSILVSSGNHPAIPEPIPFSRLPVYSAKLNQKLVIDGGSSLDLDLYDSVTGYSWDINGTGVFQEGSRVIELRPYGHAFQGQVGLRVRDEDFTTWSDPKYVDLYVAEQDLNIVVMQVDPFNLQDSNFTIRLTVANDGNSSGVIQSPLVRFFDGNPVTVGTSLGVVPLPDLAPSGQGVASLTLPISSWTPQVFVFVDPYQRVPEWDESNNIGEFAIVPNYPPHDLSLTETNLLENQPAGTLAAKIHVLDVDDLNGTGSYHYELASGLSDVNNSGFYIQGNKLFSVRVFDYEERNLYNVRLRVYDDKNASFEKTLPVPVGNVDDHIPVLHLHGEQEVYHEAFDKYIDAGAYWTDAIDAGGVVVSTGTSVGQGGVDIGTPGPYQLYYDAVDSAGNEADRIFRLVTVRDTTKPNIFLQGLPEIALEAFSPYVDPGALWVDVSDGFGVVEANGTIDLSKPGTYVLRYNSTDAAGNVADEVTRTVVVSDTTPPVIQLNGTSALIHEVGQPYLDLGAIWTDAVDGNGTLMGVGWVDINTPGTYPLTYSFTDSSGNAALPVVRTVYALDRTSPIISILGGRHLVMEAGTPYLDAGAIWLDAVDGNGSLQANETVNVNVPGTYVLSYEFVDAEGNVALPRTRTVTVMDTINPVISLTGESTVMHEAATPYVDAGAIWSDTLDGNGSVTASGSVNVNVLGTYLLTYDFKDASGNAAKQAKRMITVVDTTNPIIHLIEDQILTHEVLTAYVDPGAIWSDTLDGNGTLVASGSVKDSVSGTYFLTYNFVDAHGNAAVPVTRVVNVMDTTRPVITLTGNSSAFHEAGTPYTDFGATWLDAFDGSGSLVASGLVNENVPGTYLLSYDYTDAAGNAASRVIRTVAVVDTTSPVITLTGNPSVLHEAATAFKDSGAIVNNLVDGSISILGSGQMNVKIPGSYELTYDFTDAAGNPAKQVTRIVKVVDTTKPVISLVDGVDSVRVPLHMPFVVPELTAIDSVDGNLTSEIKERNDVNVDWPGVYESYIDVSDAAGNAAETVTVSVEVYNENPTGLHLLNDMVEENLPAGTLVGGLSTDDPNDVNGTHAYFYSMIDGGEMFSLSVDGFLRTKRPLDFEDQEVHLIKVSTTDMFDGRLEQVIEIRVVDAFTPIVETDVPVVNHSSNLLLLVGKVLDEGTNQGISEQGFVLGLQPDPKLDDPSSIVLWADRGAGRFELSPRNLLAGESYFYRAFASNTEGVGYGAQERFVAPIEPAGPAWANAEVSLSAPNWWISSWFGNFFLAENGWINHEALGWLYPTPSSENGVWFSQEKLGWMWTAPGIFPYMYVQNDASWHYFFGEVEGRIVFYRYGDGVWLDLTEGKGSQ